MPVGLKPPDSVAESVSTATCPPRRRPVSLAVVLIVGLALTVVTCSLRAVLSLAALLLAVAAVGGVPLVGAGHRAVVGSV